jgi:ArsR family transcriptional regulator
MKSLPLAECCVPLAGPSLSDDEAEELERLFRALGDRHRVKILNLLAQAADAVCVCELVPALGLSQPTVSYHLKQLVQAGLLEREQKGTYAYYRVVPSRLDRVGGLFARQAPAIAA